MKHVRRLALAICTLAYGPAAAAGDQVVGHWRLEGEPGTPAAETPQPQAGKDIPPARPVPARPEGLTYAADVPGRYIYDPLTRRSAENRSSLAFRPSEEGGDRLDVDLSEALGSGRELGSFTLEAFLRPGGELAEGDVAFVVKTRRSPTAYRAALCDDFLPRWNQHYLGASFTPPGGERQVFNAGYYLGSGRVRGGEGGWRHVALVYDATARRFTFYLDHFQTAFREAPAELVWDDGPLAIGAAPGGSGFSGRIDEVRLTRGVLEPREFLRARADPIEGVSFASEAALLPRDSGYVDLKEAFGAAGDGKTDDTAAFQKAFDQLANKQPLRRHTLYIPPGTYLVSDEVRWTRFLFVQGAGREKTVIRLRDECPGYGDADRPKGVVTTGWEDFTPEATGQAGNVIDNYLHDLTIDTGKGNPGAVGLSFHSNNQGSVANVTIRSGDGGGRFGLAFTSNWPGPTLIKNVTVRGFDVGIRSNVGQYSLTFKDLTLEGQSRAGISNRGQMLWIDGLESRNRVPAIDASGIIVLVRSELTGGDAGTPAIRLHDSYGLYRDVRVEGYGLAIRYEDEDGSEREVPGPLVEEVVFGQQTALFPSAPGTLDLPVKDPPAVPREPPEAWTNILEFRDRRDGKDWGPAIQAAVDSGARTIYFPRDTEYTVGTTVHLRGEVERLFGMQSAVRRIDGFTEPALLYDQPEEHHALVIERLGVSGLRHASPAALVIRDANVEDYSNEPGAGDLFVEDSESRLTITGQDAWIWQLNPEGDTPAGEAKLANDGGRVVVVGMKTEGQGTNILTRNGGRTELLGGYFYPNDGTGGQPSIIIEEAAFTGTWRNFWSEYEPVVRETRDGVTRGGGERYQALYRGVPR